jgi:hypothetical protein
MKNSLSFRYFTVKYFRKETGVCSKTSARGNDKPLPTERYCGMERSSAAGFEKVHLRSQDC